MDKSIVATAEAVIQIPPEVIWQAMTDPVQIKKYFFGVDVETDWQVGSPIIYRGEWDGKPFEDKGIILKNQHGKLLESSYWTASFGEDKPENYVIVRYELETTDEGTKVCITQEGNKDQAGAEHSSKNWQTVLDGLKKMLEG